MKLEEKVIQKELAKYYSGKGFAVKREVVTPVGNIDLILYRDMGKSTHEKVLIEVKEHKSIKHAIGQLISYEKYHKDATGLGIIYFTRDGKYKGVDMTFQTDQLKLIDSRFRICYIGDLIDVNELESKENTKVSKLEIVEDSYSSITVLDGDDIDLRVEIQNIQW